MEKWGALRAFGALKSAERKARVRRTADNIGPELEERGERRQEERGKMYYCRQKIALYSTQIEW